ncbi:MOSC domain-containing protein [Pseudoroseicyclus sp. CXY001]|uniref:MOSC domain-containing protein n=1 Tax=Pseudoroseicyclus sp. CXY001 TaxID=3242492 RepID=UPI003570E45D
MSAPREGSLAGIVRHPIKAIGTETLRATRLTAGEALPFDRHWAVAHEAARFAERELDGWQPKRNFIRGAASSQLMAIKARMEGSQLVLSHPTAGELTIDPESDSVQLTRWLAPLWPENRPAPRSIERNPNGPLADTPAPYVSLLSTASNAALGESMGARLDMHRWRGNLWVDGWAPWAEFDLIGQELQVGGARLRVEERITRCEATMGNPETGEKDLDTLGGLDAFGHRDFGVFCTVISSGDIALGDAVGPA